MDKFMQQMREAFANEALWKEFQTGIWDTIYSTVAATLVSCVLGIILGIVAIVVIELALKLWKKYVA